MANEDIRREPDGCYLVVEDVPEFDTGEEFSYRMLTENRIEGLLEPKLQIFNGERSLYYEITGMQSLENYASVHSLSAEDLRNLFGRLLWLSRQLPDYFLDVMNLMLSAGHIYLCEDRFYFCYELCEKKKESRREAFAGELIGLIDHEDEMAVVYAYQFYQLMQGGGELGDVLRKVTGNGDPGREEPEKAEPEPFTGETGEEDSENGQGEQAKPKRDLTGALIFLLLFLVGAALLVIRGLRIVPFSPGVLFTAREGIAGLAFALLGATGFFFTFFAAKG